MQSIIKLLILSAYLALPVFAKDSASTVKVLRQIEALASDDVGNGYTDIRAYEEADFNVGQIVNSLKEHFSSDTWGNCRFVVTVGREKNIQAMRNLKQENTTKTANLLNQLNEDGELRTIVAAHWDRKSGESVSCEVHLFEIYSKGGTRLSLEYSLTD